MYLAIDCECSYSKKRVAHPWLPEAFISSVALYTSKGESKFWLFRHKDADPFFTDRAKVLEIQNYIDSANKIIGHNFQYDYNWLEHIGVQLSHKKIWDTMIVEYLLSGQTEVMPSLDFVSEKYLGQRKLDVVKTEYWEKGVNTDEVPVELLSEYNIEDCRLTLEVAKCQQKEVIDNKLQQLVELKGEEIKCVAEIEQHGLGIHEEIKQKLEKFYGARLSSILSRIQEIAGRRINIDSPEQLSAFLFGGSYSVGSRCYYQRIFKDGSVGLRSKNDKFRKHITGIGFQPIGTEGKKLGQYSTDKNVLIQLTKQAKTKEQKEVIELLLERSSMATMMKTFIVGIKDKIIDGVVHCDLNQTITRTGRFSSSNPKIWGCKTA